MSKPAATRGKRRPKDPKAKGKLPPHPVSHPDMSTAPSSGLGNGSILAEIKEHLASGTPGLCCEEERSPAGASLNRLASTGQKNPSDSSLSVFSDRALSLTGLAISSLKSDSAQSSDTLITNPFDDADLLDVLAAKEATDAYKNNSLPDVEMCKITDLSTGRCRRGEKCGRLHVLVKNKETRETHVKTVCEAFSAGVCSRGNRCPWLHPSAEVDAILCDEIDHSVSDLFNVQRPSVPVIVNLQKMLPERRVLRSTGNVRNSKLACAPPTRTNSLAPPLMHSQPMQSTILDGSETPRDVLPGLIVKLPSPVTHKRIVCPPNYCRDWQNGNCTHRPCKFLHAVYVSESSQSALHGEASAITGGSMSPGPPIDVKTDVLNSRVPGYCWKWQRGSCRNGDRCRYKHTEPSEDVTSNAASPVLLRANGIRALPVPYNGNSPRSTKTGVAPMPLPVKEGCTFCLLGLCIGTHRTPASFVLSDAKIPQTTGPNKLSASTTSTSLMSNTAQNVEATSNPSKSRSGTKPLGPKALSGPEELTLTLLKSTRVTLGRGLQILNVSTAFESNIVSLGNLPAVISESDLRSIGAPFGEVLSVEHHQNHSAGLGSSAKLVFANHSEAASAVAALNGSMQFFAKITARPYHQIQGREIGRLSACIVRVDIPAPGIVAFAGYETLQQAEKIVAAMHGSTVKNHLVAAHLHNGLPKAGPFTVKFEGLPHQTTEKNVRAFGEGKGKPIAGDILLQKASYKSLGDVTYVLQNIFEEHGNVISFDFFRPIPFNGRIRGIARFASAAGAAAARAALNGRRFAFLGSERIYLQHLHKMTYKIPLVIHRALISELERLVSFARGQPGVQLTFNDSTSGEVEIDLSASHLDSLKRVKTPLERLIAGETLAEQSRPVWDNFFSTASGNTFIDSVSRQTGTHIRPHHIRCFVKLWGTDTAIAKAKELVLSELKRLRARKCYALPLSGKLLMQLLFNSLDAIHEEVGKEDVFVDFTARRLVIRGTEEQFHWVVDSLSKQTGSISVRGYSNHKRNVAGGQGTCPVTCPVCLDDVSRGITLDCGHSVCKGCLVRYLVSAGDHKIFPLKCLGNDNQCAELLPLPLCQSLLQKEQFARLVDASFFTYIQTRPQEFHYCPTPDCPQIYRDAPGTILQCPTCLVRICPSCHAVQHDGVECRVTSEAAERLFNEWREQHNVKTCPCCSANIEKMAGCNHLTCTSCSTHICWECLETFRASNEVYEHMVKAHGGIGL